MKRLTFLLLSLVFTFARGHAAGADDVLPQLRRGGLVIYLRHCATNPDQADTDPFHLENVKAQRHLSDAGRDQARVMGEAWRALKLPAPVVISSQFYRAQETARLLGFTDVTTTVDVTEGGLVVPPRENARRAAALRRLLATAPVAGKNTFIVSHRPNLQDAAGKEFGDLGEGELAVFEPQGGEKFRLMARIPAATLIEWGRAAKQ